MQSSAKRNFIDTNLLALPPINWRRALLATHWLIFVALKYASPMQRGEATFVSEFVLCTCTFCLLSVFCTDFCNDVVDWTFQ